MSAAAQSGARMIPLLGYRLPRPISSRLFGDRERFGRVPDPADPEWIEWQSTYAQFYESTQKQGVGQRINDSGYAVLRNVEMRDKTVLEIGPGGFHHVGHWRDEPARFILVDIMEEFLERGRRALDQRGIANELILTDRDHGAAIPLPDAAVDIVLSFYSLEHLHPIDAFVAEMHRLLKPGGLLVGAVPIEGGLAWGLGRMATSRRWLRRNTRIDPGKLICWEHPNFMDDVVRALDARFSLRRRTFYPFGVPVPDINLIYSFVYERND